MPRPVPAADLQACGGRMGWKIELTLEAEGESKRVETYLTARESTMVACARWYVSVARRFADHVMSKTRLTDIGVRSGVAADIERAQTWLRCLSQSSGVCWSSTNLNGTASWFVLSINQTPLQRVMMWRPFPIEGVASPDEYVTEGSDDETVIMVERHTRARARALVGALERHDSDSDSETDYSDDPSGADASAFESCASVDDDDGVSLGSADTSNDDLLPCELDDDESIDDF